MRLILSLLLIAHQIVVSYSQFACEANKACIINCNNANSSCSSQTIDASQATSLELYCESMLCRGIKVLCPLNSAASCDIYCDGGNTCSGIGSANPSIINSSFSSSLNLQCNGKYSCSYMLTYGPISSANIDCNGEYACSSFGAWQFNQDYYLSNTANVDITCNGTSSCRSSDYFVEYSDTVYIKITKAGTHACENCKIYGSYITSMLSMTCQEYQGCLYLDIHCPMIGSCFINSTSGSTAFDVDIFIKNDSVSDILTSGYPELLLHCTDNGINNQLISSYDSNAKVYKFYCTYSNNGCCPDKFKVNTPITCEQGKPCNVTCDGTSETCRFITIDGSSATSLSVYCDDGTWQNFACQAATILCPPAGDCSVFCSDASSCEYLTMKGNNVNNVVLSCPASGVCEASRLYMENVVGAVDISCNGCKDSIFYTSGNGNNNVNLNCVGWGICDSVTLNAENHNQVSVTCTDNNSNNEQICRYMSVNASESNTLNLICDGNSACESAKVYCPSNALQACSIQCSDILESCYNLDIFVNDSYVDNAVLLNCGIQPSNQPKCDTIDFICSPSDARTDYMYDGTCSNDNCCPIMPIIQSPTSSPTTTAPTTPDPTSSPSTTAPTTSPTTTAPTTPDPTSSPTTTAPTTANPTSNPTPPTTSNPTSNPTPPTTANPTGSPSSSPTMISTVAQGNNSVQNKLSILFVIINMFVMIYM